MGTGMGNGHLHRARDIWLWFKVFYIDCSVLIKARICYNHCIQNSFIWRGESTEYVCVLSGPIRLFNRIKNIDSHRNECILTTERLCLHFVLLYQCSRRNKTVLQIQWSCRQGTKIIVNCDYSTLIVGILLVLEGSLFS